MANITSKSTKAEIMAAYQLAINEPTTASDVLEWCAQKLRTIRVETIALARDCYRAGQWARRCYDSVRSELIQPLFKS